MTLAWPMVTGACITLALIHLTIALGDVPRGPHVLFVLAALAVATISQMELRLLMEEDLQTWNTILKWASLPLAIVVASCAGFVWMLFGTGRIWIGIAGVTLNTLAQLANFFSEVPVVRHALSLRQIQAMGASFTVAQMEGGPWAFVEMAGVFLVALFVLNASTSIWRRGARSRAVTVGGSVIFFFSISRGHAMLVESGAVQTPYFVSFAFMGVLLAMSHGLGQEVVRAARLTHELGESERRMALAAQAATLGFWTWDIPRNEIWATDIARELFETSKDERLDLERFLQTLHPEDRPAVQQAIQAAMDGAGDYAADYRVIVSRKTPRWISARGRVEFGQDGKPALMRGVLMDITAQRLSEDELEQARVQLAHAGRVSMLGQLGSALAHELNQPLGAILRNAETAEILLQADAPDLEEIRAIVSDIRRDDQRASEVIDRLRALLKRRQIHALPINLAEVIAEVITLARSHAAAANVELDAAASPELVALGDRVHLEQVLLNLIFNAVDAVAGSTETQGRIRLSARNLPEGQVEISVEDNGPGIPEEQLPHLFEPFYTTKPGGTGLGLPISRTIVEMLGGRLLVENQPGGGAIFRVILREASPPLHILTYP